MGARDSQADGDNEYEADEFEKDDLVQIAEPHKPVIHQKPHPQTKSTSQRRALIDNSDSRAANAAISNNENGPTSLMREISGVRTRKKPSNNDNSSHVNPESQQAYAPIGGVP